MKPREQKVVINSGSFSEMKKWDVYKITVVLKNIKKTLGLNFMYFLKKT